jgi:hypothetical protein
MANNSNWIVFKIFEQRKFNIALKCFKYDSIWVITYSKISGFAKPGDSFLLNKFSETFWYLHWNSIWNLRGNYLYMNKYLNMHRILPEKYSWWPLGGQTWWKGYNEDIFFHFFIDALFYLNFIAYVHITYPRWIK